MGGSGLELFATIVGLTIVVRGETPRIVLDGEAIQERGLHIDGKSYVPVGLLTKTFGAEVEYRADADVIRIKSNVKPGLRLRDLEGVKSPEEMRAWISKVKTWYEKTGTLLSLVDESKFGGGTSVDRELAESFAENVRVFKRYHKAASKLIERLERDPYALVPFELLNDFINALCAHLGDVADFGDGSEITGTPDSDLKVGLRKLSTEGVGISTEINDHRNALLLWYSDAAGNPKW